MSSIFMLKTALAHEAAYNVGYLHRDISDNNVMVVLEDGKPVKGILADWDLALRVKDENGNWIKEHNRRQRCRTVSTLASKFVITLKL